MANYNINEIIKKISAELNVNRNITVEIPKDGNIVNKIADQVRKFEGYDMTVLRSEKYYHIIINRS